MDDLLQEISAEKERVESTLQALEKTLHRKRRTFVELAAIATCLHNAYSGMENILTQKSIGYSKKTTKRSNRNAEKLFTFLKFDNEK